MSAGDLIRIFNDGVAVIGVDPVSWTHKLL
jgi:hypothetical protein